MLVSRCEAEALEVATLARLSGHCLFNSQGFLEVWRETGGTPVYLGVYEDSQLIAALPGVEFGGRRWRRFQAMPDGLYARLLFDSTRAADKPAVAGALLAHLSQAHYVKVFLNDFSGEFEPAASFLVQELTTTLVDLSVPSWEPPDRKLRQQVRKGQHEGRAIEEFDPRVHMDGFMHLVKLMQNRLRGRRFYNPGFFAALAHLAKTDSHIRWTWMEDKGEPVASSIFLVDGDQLLHWHLFFDVRHSALQPNKLMPYALAKRAAQEGLKYFNLGASPADAAGVAEYKHKWGGHEYRYRCLVRRSGWGRWF